MKKRAGTFFKNVMNKSKGLFKKEETKVDDGFDSEEDQDIIEVGKKTSSSANSLIISSFPPSSNSSNASS